MSYSEKRELELFSVLISSQSRRPLEEVKTSDVLTGLLPPHVLQFLGSYC